MKTIGIAAKRRIEDLEKHKRVYCSVYNFLLKSGKDVLVQRHVAERMGLKKYKEYNPGRNHVDMIIVLGGDGTILSVVRKLKSYNTKIFGINMGTLGFMSEISPVQIAKTLSRIFNDEYSIDERFMLKISVKRERETIKIFHALNEAVIAQGNLARMIDLSATVNGRKLTTYKADGLIISTPTGSTAYSLSAGGPIIYPSVKAIAVTPICPHSFTQKPIVLPDSKIISIKVRNGDSNITLTLDGQVSFQLEHGDILKIRKDESVRFVRLPSESFFETLRRKLYWGDSK